MPLYAHERETAKIMALAPVIPVLTVASVEDGTRPGKGAHRRRPLCDRSDLAHALGARGDQSHRQKCAKRGRGRGHDRFRRPDQPGGRGRGQVSGQSRRPGGARQGRGAIAGSVPAGVCDGLGSDGAQGAWLSGAQALSGRSRRGREAARLARSAPAGSCASARPAASISRRRRNTCGSQTCPASAGRGCCRRRRSRRGTISPSKLCRATRRGSNGPPPSLSSRARAHGPDWLRPPACFHNP